MSRLARQLRGRKKVLTIWAVLLAFAVVRSAVKVCREKYPGQCAAWLSGPAPYLLLGAVAILALPIVLRRIRANRVAGFRNQPWLYDRKILTLTARVEVVLQDKIVEKAKRHLTDAFRTATGNDDWRNRYVHQRILVSSPLLRPGCLILVLHNVKYGALPLRAGCWVRLQGEYLHPSKESASPPGRRRKRTFYGQIHFTHEPRGYLVMLDGKPEAHELDA